MGLERIIYRLSPNIVPNHLGRIFFSYQNNLYSTILARH